MEGRTWTVVQFLGDESVEAVPSNWIEGEICYWPPLPPSKMAVALRRADPVDNKWAKYPVKSFRNAIFDDYNIARTKARTAQYTSDLTTDNDTPGRRKRIPKIISSDESSCDEASVLPVAPKLDKARISSKLQQKPSQCAGTSNEQLEGDRHNGQNDGVNCDTNHVLPVNDQIHAEGQKVDDTVACQGCINRNIEYKTILEQIHLIRSIITDLLVDVKELKENSRVEKPKCSSGSCFTTCSLTFPLASAEDIDSFETILNNSTDFDSWVAELARIGGSNNYNFVKRVMTAMVTNEQALTFSWLGRKGKRPFRETHLAKLVIYAAEQAKLGVMRSETEKSIQLWLKRASDRSKAITKKI